MPKRSHSAVRASSAVGKHAKPQSSDDDTDDYVHTDSSDVDSVAVQPSRPVVELAPNQRIAESSRSRDDSVAVRLSHRPRHVGKKCSSGAKALNRFADGADSCDSDDNIPSNSDTESSESDEDDDGESDGWDDDVKDVVDLPGGQQFRWDAVRQSPPHTGFRFTGKSGLATPLVDVNDSLEIFTRFIDDRIIDTIVLETNRKAAQFFNDSDIPHYRVVDVKHNARIKKWRDTDAAEIRVFLALIIYQGIIHKPYSRMFWSTNPLYETPFVRNVMSVNRFELLERCLHFTNTSVPLPATVSGTEKILWKINPVLKPLIANFRSVYAPNRFIAIDESLMLWKGQLGIKQYIPRKRSRWGLKSYELCESGSGYIWTSIVHTGRADQMNLVPSTDGLTSSRIVLTLMEYLLGQGYRVYMDNFYSSPQLYKDLFNRKTDAVGTAKINRHGMPKSLQQKIPRNSTRVRYSGNVMALKWHDKKEVCMLSTVHDGQMRKVHSYRGTTERPAVICDYNASMGAVDMADQMLITYPMEGKRKTIWYKKFFRHLINQAVLNSYVIHTKVATKKMTHLDFRTDLISRILERYNVIHPEVKRGRRSAASAANPLRLTERHFPSAVTGKGGSTKELRRRECKLCGQKKNPDGTKVRQRTRYECSECNVGLCVSPCFKLWHTKNKP